MLKINRIGISVVTMMLASPFNAQSANMPFHDTPSGPRALQGDVLPPFGMIDDTGQFHPTPKEVPPGFDTGPNRPPETTATGPSVKLSLMAAQEALSTCLAQGYRVGVAVIDSIGQARVIINADGTDGSHGFVAMRKAEAARIFNMPSSAVNDLAIKEVSTLSRVTPSMLLDGGAVPIVAKGVVIGAIGVSGAAGKIIGQQDESCAAAGRDAILNDLK